MARNVESGTGKVVGSRRKKSAPGKGADNADFLDIDEDVVGDAEETSTKVNAADSSGDESDEGEKEHFHSSLPLTNRKHEEFAKLIVSGKSQTAAYRAVYDTKYPQRQSSLLARKEHVASRVKFLRERQDRDTGIDNAWVLDQAKRLVVECEKIDDIAKRVDTQGKAMMNLAKLKGMIKDRVEVTREDFLEYAATQFQGKTVEQQELIRRTFTALFSPKEAQMLDVTPR